MPLRTAIRDFERQCDTIVELIQSYPKLLTDHERIDIQANITRVLSAIVESEQANPRLKA
jgi:hypothetical protein